MELIADPSPAAHPLLPNLILAVLCTLVACLPLTVSKTTSLLNPAFFVTAVVVWSVLLKTFYVALFHAEPLSSIHDAVFVSAVSPDYFLAGAWLSLVAICGYVAGFFLAGRRGFATVVTPSTRWLTAPDQGHRVIVLLTAASLACFLVYLITSGTNLLDTPLSAKRFQPRAMGTDSRFLYVPYYFFKIALLSGSITYAAGVLVCLASGRQVERLRKHAFTFAFLLALLLSHFASLRLFILLVVAQVLLLTYYLKAWRHVVFMSSFAVLTFVSFGLITFVHRAPQQSVGPIAVQPSQVERSAPTVTSPTNGSPAAAGGVVPGSGGPRLPTTLSSRWAAGAFGGRYFMDVTKAAHLVHHFPSKSRYLGGVGLFGVTRLTPSRSPEGQPAMARSVNRYLAAQVFEEPTNSVPPGFTGELYINFGWFGVVVGLCALGAFHRAIFNTLATRASPVLLGACLIALIPSTTLVLLNSSLLAAAARSILDIATVLAVWGLVDRPIDLYSGSLRCRGPKLTSADKAGAFEMTDTGH